MAHDKMIVKIGKVFHVVDDKIPSRQKVSKTVCGVDYTQKKESRKAQEFFVSKSEYNLRMSEDSCQDCSESMQIAAAKEFLFS